MKNKELKDHLTYLQRAALDEAENIDLDNVLLALKNYQVTIIDVVTKKCSTCKEERFCIKIETDVDIDQITQFSRRSASTDGLAYSCKPCERLAATKSYKKKKRKTREKKYYKTNREKLLEQSRQNYMENRDTRLAQNAEYRKKNPEVWRKADKTRRDRLKNVKREPYTREEIISRDSIDGVPYCKICNRPILELGELQIDHIVPIEQGGDDVKDNVRLAHKKCNLRRPKDGRDVK